MAKEETHFQGNTKLAIEAALGAGTIIKQGFGTHFSINSKEGIHNLVTEYDTRAENWILDFLKSKTPEAHFLAEESGESGSENQEMVWVIDPLDGTVNFAHQIPVFSVSIALEERGELTAGVVFVPITQELFVAEKGKGAYLNGKKISVSKVSELHKSILATGFPYNLSENPFHCIDHFVDILRLGIPIRRLGSAAIDLAYLASGRFDGFFEVSLAPWDAAAGMLLIQEAGGRVTHWDKRPFHIRDKTPILATNNHIHEPLAKALSRSIP